MARQWEAELVVDRSLAAALVREQFGLAAATVELVAAGWDYTVHRVDGVWAFRFPRRAQVLEPLRRELEVLPQLAPLLPVGVPEPVHAGVPSEAFPWPFYGSAWLPGREATLAAGRDALAPQLGRLLRTIHDADVPGLPVDVMRRADMRLRVPRLRDELAACEEEGIWSPPAAVSPLLELAERLPPPVTATVCHGDLHVRQLLVDGSRLTGLVDWVDVCRSDPGLDLQIAFAFLEPDTRPAFFDAYGPVAEASLVRARIVALFLSAALARYGRAEANAAVEREAVASLGRALR